MAVIELVEALTVQQKAVGEAEAATKRAAKEAEEAKAAEAKAEESAEAKAEESAEESKDA
jgi:large subunit ribosomal protein L17